MSKKNYSDANDNRSFLEQVQTDLGIIYTRRVVVIKRFAREKPYKALSIMFSIVIVNFILMLYISSHNKPGNVNYGGFKNSFDFSHEKNEKIPFTFQNYNTMKSIKDSLEYLMGKKVLSTGDTLLFFRLAAKIQKLDPGFFSKTQKTN